MFTPHTEAERDAMLATIGVKKLEDLFQDVPQKYRFPKLELPLPLSEMEAFAQVQDFAAANETVNDLVCFLGAGVYHHYVPAAIDSVLSRAEFYTAYTHYQPEISQGTLQAIFEFQTLIANLTGMDVSNASHYDGATATAEAAVLAYHHFRGKRTKIVVSPSVHPHYRQTLRTYLGGHADAVIVGDEPQVDALRTPKELESLLDTNTAICIVQYPDFFGRIYDYQALADAAHAAGALFAVVANPIALSLLKPPGEFGADITVGEGQPLGIPLSYGGPYLGFFATREEYIRKVSGRLVGETVDKNGKRGYVLTLTAREQHIRREKATSNICTNQGLMALAATVYMSLLGKSGMRQVANLCYQKAHYAAEKIKNLKGYSICLDSPFFHEFAVCCPRPVEEINLHLLDHGILGGFDLGSDYPGLENHMLLAFTEMNSREDIDLLVSVLEEVSNA